MTSLITGGSGYLGGLLAERLAANSQEFVSIDILPSSIIHQGGTYYHADICDYPLIEEIFERHPIDHVYHFAAQIDFKARSQEDLYNNNVQSTRNMARLCEKFKVKKMIFTSSNSVYLGNEYIRPFSENDPPVAIDAYGRSKVFCEKLLTSYHDRFDCCIFRCPHIMDAGRLGMLSILFDFVRDNRKCWMLGDGQVHHQCLYAQELFDAMFLSLTLSGSHIFNIGTENVSTIKEMYTGLIAHAGSKSKLIATPRFLLVPLLKSLYVCGLSPLGPYQFRMLTQDFSFDISKVKSTLHWQPTLSNSQMLIKAYDYYINNLGLFNNGRNISANKGRVQMGIIDIVKYFS